MEKFVFGEFFYVFGVYFYSYFLRLFNRYYFWMGGGFIINDYFICDRYVKLRMLIFR